MLAFRMCSITDCIRFHDQSTSLLCVTVLHVLSAAVLIAPDIRIKRRLARSRLVQLAKLSTATHSKSIHSS